ncbi:MAG: ABC transporter permease [Thermoanaerobaculia bacterium]|nr:ABC transporter permease [Thermoanaerobaculia bacterium]
MNTSTETGAGLPVDSRGAGIARISGARVVYWSLRRELWENRSIHLAPLVVTAFVLLGSLVAVASLPHRMQGLARQDPARLHAMAIKPFSMAPAPIMLTTFLVGMFFCLDALYGERRDRSILFWKSLPVSDRTTVLTKAAVPLVVLPTIALVLSVITQIVMLAVSVPVLLGSAVGPAALWRELRFFEGVAIMVYGLAVHALWFAPIYGWFLLVSAWARRAPFLWATVPLLVITGFERLALDSWSFGYMLQYRVSGAMKEAFTWSRGPVGEVDRLWQLEPVRFLRAPGLWVGLLFAAVCLVAAIRLRRNREPI